MVIPKTLATNAGYDSQEVMVKLLQVCVLHPPSSHLPRPPYSSSTLPPPPQEARDGGVVGMDCDTGEACVPGDQVGAGWDLF